MQISKGKGFKMQCIVPHSFIFCHESAIYPISEAAAAAVSGWVWVKSNHEMNFILLKIWKWVRTHEHKTQYNIF